MNLAALTSWADVALAVVLTLPALVLIIATLICHDDRSDD